MSIFGFRKDGSAIKRRKTRRPLLRTTKHYDVASVLFAALAVCVVLSIVPPAVLGPAAAHFPAGNFMGALGAAFLFAGRAALGVGIYFAPIPPALAAAACLGRLRRDIGVRLGLFVAGLAVLTPLALYQFTEEAGQSWTAAAPLSIGGWLGRTIGFALAALLSWFGALVVIVLAVMVLCAAVLQRNPLRGLAATVRSFVGLIRRATESRRRRRVRLSLGPEPTSSDPFSPDETVVATTMSDIPPAAGEAVADGARAGRKRAQGATAEEPAGTGPHPPIGLLTPGAGYDPGIGAAELDELGRLLIETLETFRVEGRITGRTVGPVVTQFEVAPAPGVKVAKIAALDADLALALRASSVRIVAPIPGKGAVGVEVPNPKPELVHLRTILESSTFQGSKAQLPLALGKDLEGRPYVADLVRMPHLLIAGATGAGKSVCINTIITSLIYRHGPDSLRLLLVDPKMVELSIYADLPHLRHPVVTDPRDAAAVLRWAVLEMERRYALLSCNGARSLSEFNRRLNEGRTMSELALDGERVTYEGGPLQYIVIVIDELADLMMAAQGDVERPLAQLAQKARAIGIHLIVATQRPSVNVITGLIKANFPCRIAFRVSSKVDSRTILDQNGADALLGNGDMLFLPPASADPVRIQGAYLSTADSDAVMDWYRQTASDDPPQVMEDDILEVVRALDDEGDGPGDDAIDERDPLFAQAAEVCVQFQQGSTSLLQRRLRIGYGRAARIIDQLHAAGILGPPEGSKPREVMIGLDQLDQFLRGDTPHHATAIRGQLAAG